MAKCMMCGDIAEARYVPGIIVSFEGEKYNRTFVGTEIPKGATLIHHTEVRRVFCSCGDPAKGRHP